MSGWCGPIENQALGWDAARKHGMHGTPTYRVWNGMTQRCLNPKNGRWDDYGGRGITVCERWQIFENFVADMGERPEGETLDRYPNQNGNYEPGNCRWATAEQQGQNKRPYRSLYKRNCTICGSEFEAVMPRAKICSPGCKKEYNRRLSAEKRAQA